MQAAHTGSRMSHTPLLTSLVLLNGDVGDILGVPDVAAERAEDLDAASATSPRP